MATYRRNIRARGPVSFRSPIRATSQVENLARQLADQIIREREAAKARQKLGRIFTTFDATDDVLPNNVETVTRGLFTGNTGSLVVMYTSSNLTTTQKTYFQEVYSTGDPASSPYASSELSIAYGHFHGSGSKDTTGNLNNDTPTRAIYKQYAQLLLAPNDKKFTINGINTDQIYILNFNRARMREKLDPGNFELTLAQLSGSFGAAGVFKADSHTGSNVRPAGKGHYVQIIDDSSLTSGGGINEGGLVYNLVSGSIDEGTQIHNSSAPKYYGLLYPQQGVAILNGEMLNKPRTADVQGLNFGTVTGSGVQGDNAMKLFASLSSSNDMTPSGVNGGIQARSSEQVKSTYYFVRVKNAEYNYSNNPTFVTGSLGEIAFSTMISDPQAYVTTVGLYNARREMLAVAKLSQPLLKNFTREALIKVKLDF
jgi:hypothetical protein